MIDDGRRAFCRNAATLAAASRALPMAALLSECFVLEGCTLLDDIAAWTPLAIDGVSAILLMLDPPAGLLVATIAPAIKSGMADLAAAVNAYEKAPPADKATLGGKIKRILSEIGTHFQDFLSALANIPGIAPVISLVTLIVNTIAGFAQRAAKELPGVMHAVRTEYQLRGRTVITVQPIEKPNKKDFMDAFNARMDAAGHSDLHIPLKK